MALKNHLRVLFSWPPNGDARIGAASSNATVRRHRDGVDRAIMEAEHLLGCISLQRPADRGTIKAARHGGLSVWRDAKRPDRPPVGTQLCVSRGEAKRPQQKYHEELAAHSFRQIGVGMASPFGLRNKLERRVA